MGPRSFPTCGDFGTLRYELKYESTQPFVWEGTNQLLSRSLADFYNKKKFIILNTGLKLFRNCLWEYLVVLKGPRVRVFGGWSFQALSPLNLRASWISFSMIVTRFVCIAQRLVSSKIPTMYASATS